MLGAVGADEVAEDDDIFIVVCPTSIVGNSIIPPLQEMCKAAGDRPVIIFNQRMGDLPSSGGVMGVQGRKERLQFISSFETVYHFRLLYNKPYWFPIYGALRKVRSLVCELGSGGDNQRECVRLYSDDTDANRYLGQGLARPKLALERWTNPKLSRCTCSPRHGLQSCRRKSAGVAKRPRERSPTRNPLLLKSPTVTIRNCLRLQ